MTWPLWAPETEERPGSRSCETPRAGAENYSPWREGMGWGWRMAHLKLGSATLAPSSETFGTHSLCALQRESEALSRKEQCEGSQDEDRLLYVPAFPCTSVNKSRQPQDCLAVPCHTSTGPWLMGVAASPSLLPSLTLSPWPWVLGQPSPCPSEPSTQTSTFCQWCHLCGSRESKEAGVSRCDSW